MERKEIVKVITWSTIAMIIPIFGQLVVNGWNWGLGDFVFAWVFFNLFGFTCTFVTNKVKDRRVRSIVGILVITAFVFVWVTLATG